MVGMFDCSDGTGGIAGSDDPVLLVVGFGEVGCVLGRPSMGWDPASAPSRI